MRPRTFLAAFGAIGLVALVLSTTSSVFSRATSGLQPPAAAPVQVCGNAAILDGPATQPAGSVRVDPRQNLNDRTQAAPEGTTFWLAPGTHTLGDSPYDQIITKTNNTYIGAPGAILDGKGMNNYAFATEWGNEATGVTIKYLTVRNFQVPQNGGAVNPSSSPGWRVENNTLGPNAGGHGLYIGTDNVVRYNCITSNGQGGFGTYRPGGGPSNLTVTHNEIVNNNTEDLEATNPDCGCTYGGKFWEVNGAVVAHNWVHDNKATGIWADVNNMNLLIEHNLIEDNDREGIFYEASYNAVIRNNFLRRNALIKGAEFASRGDNFPIGAIYISESGGDARLPGSPTLEIYDNTFENNWDGVVLYEGVNRFCGSPAHPGDTCTPFADRNTECVPGIIDREPHYSNCRWMTQNVRVHHNTFAVDPTAIGCTNRVCARQALISDGGSYPDWSPYKGNVIKDRITFASGNLFSDNTYVGPWHFMPYDTSREADFAGWQADPYNQDMSSQVTD